MTLLYIILANYAIGMLVCMLVLCRPYMIASRSEKYSSCTCIVNLAVIDGLQFIGWLCTRADKREKGLLDLLTWAQ